MTTTDHRIPRDAINRLAQLFIQATRDDQKRDIVLALGESIANHADFIDQLNNLTGGHGNIAHSYAFRDYMELLGETN